MRLTKKCMRLIKKKYIPLKKKKKRSSLVKYKPDKGLIESNMDIEVKGNV